MKDKIVFYGILQIDKNMCKSVGVILTILPVNKQNEKNHIKNQI